MTQIAIENKSSRKFVRGQKAKAAGAIDAALDPAPTPDKVLFQLPVTQQWMDQLTLSILLGCNGSYRKTATVLNDVFDYATSPGTITAIVSSAVKKAQQIHTTEDLSGIKVTANELFRKKNTFFSNLRNGPRMHARANNVLTPRPTKQKRARFQKHSIP